MALAPRQLHNVLAVLAAFGVAVLVVIAATLWIADRQAQAPSTDTLPPVPIPEDNLLETMGEDNAQMNDAGTEEIEVEADAVLEVQ